MQVWKQELGPLQTNAYVLINNHDEAIVIDPGMNADPLLKKIQSVDVVAILLTHAHFDHIGGLEQVRQRTKAPVYIHELEASWLQEPRLNGSAAWETVTEPILCQDAEKRLEDGQQLQMAGFHIDVRHTPGHSPGSVSFYIENMSMIIAGDTLFAGSIGRTDLPGGDHDQLLQSIRAQILTLNDETTVYPGHGPHTTVKEEKRWNPFLTGQ